MDTKRLGKIGLSLICILSLQVVFGQTSWNVGGGGMWTGSGNWTNGLPSNVKPAIFPTIAPETMITIGLSAAETAESMMFNGTTSYAINAAGAGSISCGGISFSSTATGHTIDAPIIAAPSIVIDSSSSADCTIEDTLSSAGISGGSVIVEATPGSGRILFPTANSYTGGTTLQTGTLGIGNNGSLGGTSALLTMDTGTTLQPTITGLSVPNPITLSGNATIDTKGFGLTLGGVLTSSSSQTLTIINSSGTGGTLSLSPSVASSLAGTTIIKNGITVVFVSANAFAGGGTIQMDTGTLQSQTNPVTLSNAISLTGPGLTSIDPHGQTLTLSGLISGANPLNINDSLGGGTVILNHANNYSGATTINSGTLSVSGAITSATTIGSGGTLTGTGTVGDVTVSQGGFLTGNLRAGAVSNSGTVAPGNSFGTPVYGTYTQTGTLIDKIDPQGGTDFITVTGAATLGGVLEVVPAGGIYDVGTKYTILTAGTLNGGFASSFSANPTVQFSVAYVGDSVILTIETGGLIFGGPVNHHNPQQVAAYLVGLSYNLVTDLTNVAVVLSGLSDPTSALDQLHPAIFGAFDLLNANTSSLVSSIFTHRLSTNHPAHIDEPCDEEESTDSFRSFVTRLFEDPVPTKNRTQECKQLNVWLEPFGYYMEQDRIGEQVGFYTDVEGVLMGADYTFCNGIVAGVGGGYNHNHIKWKHHRGHGDVNGGYFGVYSDWIKESFFVDLALVGGINSYNASRNIQFGTIDRVAKHSKVGYDFTVHLGGGTDFIVGCNCPKYSIEPFVNLDYLFLQQRGFREHGADSLDLVVKTRNSNMLRSQLGLGFSRSFSIGDCGCFAPIVWVSCVNEAYLQTKHYDAALAGEGGHFAVRTFNKPITLFVPGIDLAFLFDGGLSLVLRYSAEVNHYIATQKGDLRLAYNF